MRALKVTSCTHERRRGNVLNGVWCEYSSLARFNIGISLACVVLRDYARLRNSSLARFKGFTALVARLARLIYTFLIFLEKKE